MEAWLQVLLALALLWASALVLLILFAVFFLIMDLMTWFAQRVEIADGVTLLEGIRACLGEDGMWLPSFRYVSVMAGPAGFFPIDNLLCVDVLKKRIGLHDVSAPRSQLDEEAAKPLLEAFIRAAKDARNT